MASPISSTIGVGSGLNIGDIVKVLVDSDKAAKQNQIDKQTAKTTGSLSAVAKIKSALTAFQDSMKALNSTTAPAFLGYAATSSAETVVKATANNTAVNGTYTIGVSKLATASKVATAALTAAQTSAIPSGDITISQNGTNHKVTLEAGGTLEDARNAINKQLQTAGISANIITDGDGSRLVFSSTTTGKGSDISVVGSGNVGTLLDIDGTKTMSDTAVGGVKGAGAISAVAGDAEFTVDGLAITSKSNTVSGAISGLSFDLLTAGSNGAQVFSTITVATNTDGLKTSLNTFMTSYNTLVNLVGTLTKGTTDSEGLFVPAELTGDSTAAGMLSAIRDQIATATTNSGLGSLAQLGITTQSNGTLSMDSAKFNAAMNDKKMAGQVQSLFSGDTGLLARIGKAIDPYAATGGILATKTTQLTKTQNDLTNQQEALNRRIASLTDSLTKKYNAMDLVVAQLKATASSITSIFEAMNAQKNAS
ncbi:flagellar filament capping protein FliD [Pseudomonas viridiflava]|uniref:flagellar filament capping protein FliD n=1 Tax=Pseudomonas viridiflava TaxID=33069 RepID=UPI000F04EAFB|nr:flagellar filament capping protein FliD [Pseudomonas viridiflava]